MSQQLQSTRKTALFTTSPARESAVNLNDTKLDLDALRAFVRTYLKVQYKILSKLPKCNSRSRCSPPQWERWLRIANRVVAGDRGVWACEDLEELSILLTHRNCSIRILELLMRNLAEGKGRFVKITHKFMKQTFVLTGWVKPIAVKLLTEKVLVDQLWEIIEPQTARIVNGDFVGRDELVKTADRISPSFHRSADMECYDAHTWVNREIAIWFQSLRSVDDYEVELMHDDFVPIERPAPDDEEIENLEAMRRALPSHFRGLPSVEEARHDSDATAFCVSDPYAPSEQRKMRHDIVMELEVPLSVNRGHYRKEILECGCGIEHHVVVATFLGREREVVRKMRRASMSF